MALPDSVFNTIVVGVDGRQGGRDALRLAGLLAEAGGGDLIAVRVFPHQHRPALARSPAVDEERESTQVALDRELADMGMTTARAHVVGDTSPARALHRMAERERADVLVVGSAHRGAVGRVLGGDVALGSLHGSPCPVAVAPRGMADRDATPLTRIGVGFDGTPESREALAVAVALAKSARVELELLCAATPPIPLFAEAAWADGAIVDYRPEAEELISRTLGELDVEAVGKAVVGGPVETLVELTHRVDVLVVGSRGWGPIRRILLGSTAARLIREAACPVLVVPRGAATGEPGEQEPTRVEAAPRTAA
jgi:nucleotide-binding universal stress UspA family protein